MPGYRVALMSLSTDDLRLRQQLRHTLRRQRRALSPAAQRHASRRFIQNIAGNLHFRRARRLGVYLAADGELDPLPGLRGIDQANRLYCLPVLPKVPDAVLHFALWHPGKRLIRNRYNIGEPALAGRALVPLWTLDVLLMPLVAFDDAGNRLGMGGGFYDRALASLSRKPKRPRLIGVAHHFQRVAALPAATWDQPLDDIITG
jgi:5-formyltetrahydrofolate cyclo-ligase